MGLTLMGYSIDAWELAWPLGLIALAAVPLLVYAAWRGLVRGSLVRRLASLAVRVLLVAVVALALAGPRVWGLTDRQFTVVAVDQSLSTAGSRAQVDAFCREVSATAGRHRLAFLPFASRPGAVTTHWPGPPPKLDPLASNPAAAVMLARAILPPDYVPQIVLLSDGNATEGDLPGVARSAGVPISVVPLAGMPKDEVYLAAIRGPQQVRQDESWTLEVVVRSNHDDEGTVALDCGGQPLVRQRGKVAAGDNVFRFSLSAARTGLAVYTARIEGFRDTVPGNNHASAAVFVAPPAGVLLVEGEPGSGRALTAALGAARIRVEPAASHDLPQRLEDLCRYDALVFSNVPAVLLAPPAMEAVRRYVRDTGGGLVLVGGDRAFTSGGYAATILEEILPLASVSRAKSRKPDLALVLVIDRSESMAGKRITLAKEAMRRAVELLGPQDQVGVLTYEDESLWVCPLAVCSDKPRILRQIAAIRAEGRTNMAPAMEKAYLALRESYAELKHIIVTTDGLSHVADFTGLTRRIADDGITVSTLGVGDEVAGPVLDEIARIGHGRYYACADVAALPRIFAMETASAGKQGITEGPFFAKRLAPPCATGSASVPLPATGVPALLGYDETQAKPGSEMLLATPSDDPLLARWRLGSGMAVAFTSDAEDHWARAWLGWPGFGPFWAGTVRGALRAGDPRDLAIEVTRQGPRGRLSASAAPAWRQLFPAGRMVVRVADPQGVALATQLRGSLPGQVEVEFPLSLPGVYRIAVETRVGDRPVRVQERGLSWDYPEELRFRPADTAVLKSIAAASGGRYDPRAEDVWRRSGPRVPYTMPLWPALVATALLLLAIDVRLKRG